MDRNFARALALVLKSEGGWSDNPKDPGGATMNGVTLANFRRYVQANGTKDDLRHITDEQLATCYKRFYWDAVNASALPDGVDYAVFDFAVNSGPGRAAKYLQMTVGAPQDGQIGSATLQALKARPTSAIINSLCDLRLAFLKRLPTWDTFGKGWSDRVRSVRLAALLMAGQPAATAPQKPAPTAPMREPQPLPTKPSKVAPAVTVVALVAMALAGFWHHIVTAIQGIF
ncbi:glycoside hydrolase family 108 protein [Mesorhizobium sp. URHB0026]